MERERESGLTNCESWVKYSDVRELTGATEVHGTKQTGLAKGYLGPSVDLRGGKKVSSWTVMKVLSVSFPIRRGINISIKILIRKPKFL